MDYLGRDKQMAQTQLLLLSSERNKLKQERDDALRTAAELRSQMNGMQDTVVQQRADLQVRAAQHWQQGSAVVGGAVVEVLLGGGCWQGVCHCQHGRKR